MQKLLRWSDIKDDSIRNADEASLLKTLTERFGGADWVWLKILRGAPAGKQYGAAIRNINRFGLEGAIHFSTASLEKKRQRQIGFAIVKGDIESVGEEDFFVNYLRAGSFQH